MGKISDEAASAEMAEDMKSDFEQARDSVAPGTEQEAAGSPSRPFPSGKISDEAVSQALSERLEQDFKQAHDGTGIEEEQAAGQSETGRGDETTQAAASADQQMGFSRAPDLELGR